MNRNGDISFSNDDIGLLQFCAEADLPRSEGDYDHLGARSLLRGNDLATCHRTVEDADCGLDSRPEADARYGGAAEYRCGTHDAFLCAPRRSEDFGTCESPQMGVLHLPEVLPGFAGFPSAVQRSGDDHLPASRRIVPGSGMGACRSAAGLDAGIHLWFEMALAGATNPLGTAFSGRGAARIDGHHRYGEWQDCGGRIQQFRCPLASRRYRHRHRRNGDRMGNLQLSN